MIDFDIKNRWSGKVMFTAPIDADEATPIGVKIGLAVKWALRAKKPLAWANLPGAYLVGTNLAGTNLTGTNLAGTNLARANLARARLTGTNLARANLNWAKLNWANLAGADLVGADLTGADLADANLPGANLTRATLTGATLTEANLDGANLTGATLDGAYVHGELVTRVIARLNREIDPYSFVAFKLQAGGVKVLAGCRWFTVAEYRAHVAANYPDTDKAIETARILDYIEARARDLGIALEPLAREADSADTFLKLQSAEARAQAAEARVEVLERALRPFADAMFSMHPAEQVRLRDFAAAIQALGASHG
jgi:hypothetical protein